MVILWVYNSREVVKNSGVKSRILVSILKFKIVKNILLNFIGNGGGVVMNDVLVVRVWILSIRSLIKFFLGDDNYGEIGVLCVFDDDVI